MKEKQNFTIYKQHPLSGGSFANWIRLLLVNGGVDFQYISRALAVSRQSLQTIPLRVIEQVKFNSIIENTPIPVSPIFIIGHWRSGTTYLFNAIAQDPNLGYISRLKAFRGSEIFLSYPQLARLWAEEDFNRKRMSDNMIMSADFPCEEEFALANTAIYSFYSGLYFPRNIKKIFEKYVLFEGIDKREKNRWEKTYTNLIKKATLSADGKRLVLKNPLNTARIPILLKMFPDAKFIHIYRNPYKVYASTNRLFKKLILSLGFQTISELDIQKNTLLFYKQMMQKFLNDNNIIKPENFVEIKYEDFIGNELEELRKIYTRLDICGFEAAEPEFKKYIQSQKNYQVNRYILDENEVNMIETEWKFAFDVWPYNLSDDMLSK